MPLARAHAETEIRRLRIRVWGAVQGVGFRPFVHRLAVCQGLAGFVLNDSSGVLVEVEGRDLDPFIQALKNEAPPLARIDDMDVIPLETRGDAGFAIRASAAAGAGWGIVTADAAPCPSCLGDLFDPSSRFHLYPFVTCTDCGPRFTILRQLPYDRPNTSMAGFILCAACAGDYHNPGSRRFHAETIACPLCGPRLSHSIAEIVEALQNGLIVALKGIGGFHLLCDATNEEAVARLRRRKHRPAKPFAVMAANMVSVTLFAAPRVAEEALLDHIGRPIVLVRGGETNSLKHDVVRKPVPTFRHHALAPSVAPGLSRIGVMLPSAPLHHLIFHALAGEPPGTAWRDAPQSSVLVATSANASGEPLVIDDAAGARTLAEIADLVVTHDRPILVRADDSVMAVIAGAPAFIRRSRGFVPDPIDLDEDGPVVLATGGHLKAALCVTRGREAFMSQHIGDLGGANTVRFYAETARRMLEFLGVEPEMVVCDLHPDYRSTLFAESTGLPLLQVQHHAAHLAAVAAEHHLRGPILGVALDGSGYGEDGGAWGGELMRLDSAAWRRLGHLAPLAVLGGERAATEPWRMGVAALIALGRGTEAAERFPDIVLAGRLAASRATTPETSSMGRLFDAAAALLGVRMVQSFEGQAATELEGLVRTPRYRPGGYRIDDGILDFRPLLAGLLEPDLGACGGAELFHGTLIAGLIDWIGRAADEQGHQDVALGGGCLMNAVLAEGLASGLRARGLVALLPRAVPANDGGLSLGQAAMARAFLTEKPASDRSPRM